MRQINIVAIEEPSKEVNEKRQRNSLSSAISIFKSSEFLNSWYDGSTFWVLICPFEMCCVYPTESPSASWIKLRTPGSGERLLARCGTAMAASFASIMLVLRNRCCSHLTSAAYGNKLAFGQHEKQESWRLLNGGQFSSSINQLPSRLALKFSAYRNYSERNTGNRTQP